MNASNPYAVPETPPRMPVRVQLRDQQLFLQTLLFSIFYFAGFGCLIAVDAGISAVPQFFADVVEEFSAVWRWELMFALVPYIAFRTLTIGRLVRPSWWSFCVAGFATFPFLNFYSHLLFRFWDTSLAFNVAAHLLSIVSAILTELLALAMLGELQRRGRIAVSKIGIGPRITSRPLSHHEAHESASGGSFSRGKLPPHL